MTIDRRPFAIGLFLMLACSGCADRPVQRDALAAAPAPSASSAADSCNGPAADYLTRLGATEVRLQRAVDSTRANVSRWQSNRFAEGQGPRANSPVFDALPPDAPYAVCVFDVSMAAVALPVPPGAQPPTADRVVVLVDGAGVASLDLITSRAKFGTAGPPPN
jgi:hypothetical protein